MKMKIKCLKIDFLIKEILLEACSESGQFSLYKNKNKNKLFSINKNNKLKSISKM